MQTGSQDAAAGGLRFSRCGNSCARLNVQTREIQRKMQRPGQEAVASSSKPDRPRHHRARGCVRSILHPGGGLGGWGRMMLRAPTLWNPKRFSSVDRLALHPTGWRTWRPWRSGQEAPVCHVLVFRLSELSGCTGCGVEKSKRRSLFVFFPLSGLCVCVLFS